MGLLDQQDNRYHFASILLSYNGTFWDTYGDHQLPQAIFAAIEMAEWQMLQDKDELLRCATYNRVPVYHRERWLPITIRESEITQNLLRFGDGAVFGPQPLTGKLYRFGIADMPPLLRIGISEDIIHAALITSGITTAAVSWYEGIDYTIQAGVLLLTRNPFDFDFEIRDVYENGEVSDRELTLWLHQADLDRRYLSDHFGFLYGIDDQSSESLSRVVESVYEGNALGTTDAAIKKLVEGATGVLVAQGTEVVTLIHARTDKLQIITDQRVYTYHPSATPLVEVGDTVAAGQELVTATRFYDLAAGAVPASLMGLAVEQNMLSTDYVDGLLFENKVVDVVAETVNSKTKLSFELGGFVKDVELFWNEVHTRGVSNGETLANMLDVRESPTTEPSAASLPSTVNPLQFLVENLFRFSACVITVNVAQSHDGAGLRYLQLLRRLVPPWYLVIVLFEVQLTENSVTMDSPGDENTPGGEDFVEATYGSDPQFEYIDPTVSITEQISASYTSFTCR